MTWMPRLGRRTALSLAVVGVALAALLGRFAWTERQEKQLRIALREQAIRAQTSRDRGAALQAIARRLPPSSLERLEHDLDEGVALAAAFALHNVRAPSTDRLEPEHAAEFLQFFRRRTRLIPPDWWGEHLPEFSPDIDPEKLPDVRLDIGDLEVRITSGKAHLVVSSDVFRLVAAPTLARHTAAAIGGERAFLATYGDEGENFPLVAVASLTGLPVWQTEVWALGADNLDDLSGRRWRHAAELTLDGPWLIVWGAGTGGSYVEVFDSDTGANRFRFCTRNWFAD